MVASAPILAGAGLMPMVSRAVKLVRRILPEPGITRVLAVNSFVGALGFGFFTASTAIFFIRSVGLSTAQVGSGMAVAGLVGVLSSIGIGKVVDKRGPRELVIILALAEAALLFCYVFVHSFLVFLVVVTLLGAAERGGSVARNVLLSRLLGREKRVTFKAYQRSIFNVGVSIGTLLAAVPLQLDTRAGYLSMVLCAVVVALVSAVLTTRLPRVQPLPQPADAQRWIALRDRSYLGMSLLNGLITVYHSTLIIAVPIWVVSHTSAPPLLVGVLFFVNTLLSVTLQVAASKGVDTVESAARASWKGALVLAPACLLLGLSAQFPTAVAVSSLVLGVVLLTLGEIWTAAAAWTFSFEMAPEHAQGQYQGVFSLGMATESVVGPLIMSLVVLAYGTVGWFALAGLFLLLGAALRSIPSWKRLNEV